MPELKTFMEKQSLLSTFTAAEREQLISRAERVEFERGEYIHLSGDNFPYVFILTEGLIYAIKDLVTGRSVTMKRFNVGDVFLGHALFADNPTPSTLAVFRPSVIYRWHQRDILPIIKNNEEVLWKICCQLSNRSLEAMQIVEEFSSSPVSNRLARLLAGEFAKAGESCIPRNLTLDEIASSIGSTKEVVCRYLRRMSDENLIQVERDRFVLVNKIELKKLADSSYTDDENWEEQNE